MEIGWWKTSFLTLDGLKSLVLPAITLGVYQLTLTMRLVRSEMQDVLKTDYIKFANARGIAYRSLYYKHALRNTLVPVITIIGLQFGGVIAFFNCYRISISMARYGFAVSRLNPLCGYTGYVGLSGFDCLDVRGYQSVGRLTLLCYRSKGST